MYFFTPNSTAYSEPFVDNVMASVAWLNYPSYLQRINIFYQSISNPEDITARTVPAYNDFYIPNSSVVTNRMANLTSLSIYFSAWYYDQLSLS
jgi:hypothetical protein